MLNNGLFGSVIDNIRRDVRNDQYDFLMAEIPFQHQAEPFKLANKSKPGYRDSLFSLLLVHIIAYA